MNWLKSTEQKRNLLVGGLIIICLAMLAVTARRNNVSHDVFWHLRAGLDWINQGISPWYDHFSFTFYGEPIAGPPYLFQALIGWSVKSLGFETGLEIFILINFVLTLALIIYFLKKLRAPVVIYGLVLPLVVVLLQLRAIVRPELISYSLCVIALMLYYRAHSILTVSTMVPILALMLFWNNYHSSIFGYIIFFGLFVDVGIQQWQRRLPVSTWLNWLGWGFAILAVGFINPQWSHPLVQVFTFSPEWKELIQEYQSPMLYKNVAAIYALIAIAVTTLPLLLWKQKYGLLIISCILIYFSTDVARLVTPCGIIILCIFAWVSSENSIVSQLSRLPQRLNAFFGGLALVLVILSLGSGLTQAREFMAENLTSQKIFPRDVTEYMAENKITGRIFSEYGLGGYLAYELSPGIQVYIDGRTGILYPLEHSRRYQAARKAADELRLEIQKYDISLVLFENSQEMFSFVHDTGLMGLDFVGENFSLFTRSNPNFPAFGKMMANPSCWDAELADGVRGEQTPALWLSPQQSVLLPLVNLAVQYSETPDQQLFLENLEKEGQWNEFTLRFAGYRALSHGLNDIAYDLFAAVNKKQLKDYLATAWAKYRLGELQTAEEILDSASKIPWPNSKQSDLIFMVNLLTVLNQARPLELIEETYLNELTTHVEPDLAPKLNRELTVENFCSDF